MGKEIGDYIEQKRFSTKAEFYLEQTFGKRAMSFLKIICSVIFITEKRTSGLCSE